MPETTNPTTSPGTNERGTTSARGGPRWLRPAVVRLVLLFVVFFLGVQWLASLAMLPVMDSPLLAQAVGVGLATIMLLLYVAAVRITERRSVTELRIRALPVGLLGGTILGFLLFTAVIAVIALFDGYQVTGSGSVDGMMAVLGMMCVVAVIEELVFRGVLLRVLEEITGVWGALAISSVLFGAMHIPNNPGATVWGAIAIAVEAGLMLGAAYLVTRSLWLPIGLHLGWNFASVGVFGVTTSGVERDSMSLLEATTSGPDLLTGGDFGPEASLVAIGLCTVLTVLFLFRFRMRSRSNR
ncbi:MAG: CPBP family intramembrane metalloprotease [Nocardiopsaceae bacterium]|nr:CPBP family intramembrane metalloprotease [Nocardiopsaceae bacterium]